MSRLLPSHHMVYYLTWTDVTRVSMMLVIANKRTSSKRANEKKHTHTFLFSRWNRCNWFYSLIIRQWYKLYKKKQQTNQWISSQTNLTNRYKRSVFFGSCAIIPLIRLNFGKNSRRNSFPIQTVSFKPIRKDMHSSMFDSKVK